MLKKGRPRVEVGRSWHAKFAGVSPSGLESSLRISFACNSEYSNYLRFKPKAGQMVKMPVSVHYRFCSAPRRLKAALVVVHGLSATKTPVSFTLLE